MRKKVILVSGHLHGVMVLMAVLSVVSLALSFMSYPIETYFLYGLLILIPYAVTAVAAEKAKGIGVYLLVSIASMIPVALFAPDTASKAVFLVLSALIMVIRIGGRMGERRTILNSPLFATVILFAILYIVGIMTENDFLATLNYYLSFAYMINTLIYMNLSSLEGYLAVNRTVANVPVKKIGRTNNVMLLVYLGLAVALMFIVPFLGLDKAIRAFGRALLEFIRFLASLHHSDGSVEETYGEETLHDNTENLNPELFPDVETPVWLEAVYHALSVVMIIAAIVAGIALISYGIYKLIKKFYRPRQENGDEEEFIDLSDERNRLSADDGIISRLRERLDNSPNAVVRRTYRKNIQRQKTEFSKALTPYEIEETVGLPAGDERQNLHELYEKARYSADGCTEEDVRKLKKGAAS